MVVIEISPMQGRRAKVMVMSLAKPAPEPENPGSLKQRAYTDLKGRILSGSLQPGVVLSERQLAGEMRMSKTPVHAAIERLEADGLILVGPRKGIVVREVSPREMADHFEVREAVEPFVVAKLAGRLRAEQSRRLSRNLRENRRAARSSDVGAVVTLDSEFHVLLCEFLGNREFSRLMSQIREKVHAVIYHISLRFPERMIASLEEHESVVEALLAGDAAEAAQRMRGHLRHGMQRLYDRSP